MCSKGMDCLRTCSRAECWERKGAADQGRMYMLDFEKCDPLGEKVPYVGFGVSTVVMFIVVIGINIENFIQIFLLVHEISNFERNTIRNCGFEKNDIKDSIIFK